MAAINAELNVKTTTGYDQINLKTQSGIVTYDNTTSGLASTTTKGAIDELRDADNIKYNNAVSGLIATDVQGAIDEVNNTLTQTNTTISDMTAVVSFTTGGSINTEYSFSMPTGFTKENSMLIGMTATVGTNVLNLQGYGYFKNITSSNQVVYMMTNSGVLNSPAKALFIKL